ncbi:MAG: OmpH family outer membrane protein [Deltaproteobacteria bacterium]|nr:OmpH family outer membrane protein [Deltaproteobacteria bacterium]
MKTIHTVTVISFLLMQLAITVHTEAQSSKIAIVDIQRALNETEDGRTAKEKLKTLFQRRQKTLDEQQESLKKMKENLEAQRNVLSREALGKKLEEYQKALVELQTVYMEYQKELATKEGELTKDIIERMQFILRRIGQKEGYSLIIERNEAGVIFVPTNLDLTDVLIQKYNAGEGKSEMPSKSESENKNKNKNKKPSKTK